MYLFTILIYVLVILLIINTIFATSIVFFERRNPASTWSWIFVLFFIPVFGFIIYMIIGRNSRREKIFRDKTNNDFRTLTTYVENNQELNEKVKKQALSKDGIDLSDEYKYLKDFATLNVASGSWITYNNSISRFTSGEEKFQTLINDMRNAKKFIHLEYYILRGDGLGMQIIEELTNKAKEGIEVRLLYDYMGNFFLPQNFFKKLTEEGGQVTIFKTPRFTSFNCRNHRKIAVIDGEIGYVGGFNIGDEYLGKVERFGKWRDTHVRFEGEVVEQLQIRFMMDWNHSTNNKFKINDFYYPKSDKIYGYLPAQIVCSGPDTQWRNVKNSYFKMINEAENSVYIVTPYFSPGEDVLTALKVAALSGIDVRIIIPGKPDHPFVYWSSMSFLGELIDLGVKCYSYESGFIHSKTLVIDGIVATVGTANMDRRSFDINFEINSFVYDPQLVALLEEDFFKDMKNCVEITKEWYDNRGRVFKCKEALSRLISPVL